MNGLARRLTAIPMISLPFRRPPRHSTIDGLYGAIVAQARCPAFYRNYGVPDTVAGRLDMIVLHLVLVLRRLRAVPPSGEPDGQIIAQQLFDRFCEDVDDNLREMGVGDLAVPKQMRRVGEAFYGRTKAYEAALALEDGNALVMALVRNVFGAGGNPAEPALGALRLAAYIRKADARLAAKPTGSLTGAELDFPAPEIVGQPALQEGHS
jgi:cytochrome b pre-mRNA-processing protein 3